MKIEETCSCGAILKAEDNAISFNEVPYAQNKFHRAHEKCREKVGAQISPINEGEYA